VTELVITRGLPASGKSTWARAWVKEDPLHRAEVNRDHLREMLHGGFVGDAETQVTQVSHGAIELLLKRGVSVVCSDTNLPQRSARDLAKLGRKVGADVRVKDFTYVPLQTCLDRNTGREWTGGFVPPNVIRDMHTRYIKGRTYPLPLPEEDSATADAAFAEYVPGAGTVILVDIDGTVALKGDRSPFDESRVHEDRPNQPVIDAVHAAYLTGNGVVFLSGRTDACRDATKAWLDKHVGPIYRGLYMRRAGDFRKDSIVKRELFDRHIRGVLNVRYVLDDRNQVVEMWREELGLTCLQCAPGNF
jgi:predicted kinase